MAKKEREDNVIWHERKIRELKKNKRKNRSLGTSRDSIFYTFNTVRMISIKRF
jgi:hypothetical protein